MTADLRALLAEVRALAEAARALHVRLDEMQPHLEDVCAIAHVHGAPYCGPRWADERATMEAALAVVEARLLALAEGEGAACRHGRREVVTAMTCLDCGSLVPLAESVRQALATPPPASAEGARVEELSRQVESLLRSGQREVQKLESRVRALEAALGEARELCDAAVTWWTVERETDMDAAVDCDAKHEALCSLMAAHAALENAAKKYAEARAFLADREG